ncbi:hypothetical protein SAMN02949497_1835 [Methylomagnum ishizawai]|uniref:DUF4276 family protein n=1 Tax=Methylomagnum ishizawai TaxID=1760988 RepID=A0A1Y6CW01_9GAMM|nr:hypothetical protein [Methylomagnum ishizawai]SMF94517.1 hypothetical protein SAMN02949497_1835 [Methylomagnum ishizawai]
MNVLIIPEDFRKDQYLLQPIVAALLSHLGKPRAKVTVLKDPLLGGVARALDFQQLKPIIERYRGMVDVFLLCVDRDGEQSRRLRLGNLESQARAILPENRIFLAENAWQELEVWALAGLDLPKEWAWRDIRAERDPKERYFKPIAERRGLLDEPGEGRRTLGIEAAKRYAKIRQRCPEDIQALEGRIETACASR